MELLTIKELREKNKTIHYHNGSPIPYNDKGFFGAGNQKELSFIFNKHKIKTVLELGSFLGKSTEFFAKRAEKVYCVDTWKGSPEWFEPHRTEMHPLLDKLYPQFLTNMIVSGVEDKTIPIRLTTDEFFEKAAPVLKDIDLVYIDADHATEAVYKDILNSLNYFPNAIICGDDWRWESVRKAIGSITCEFLWLKLIAGNNFWILEKGENQ